MRYLEVKVRCGNGFHVVRWVAGRLFFPQHEREEFKRACILAELGDTECGCARLLREWRVAPHNLRSPFMGLRATLDVSKRGRRLLRRTRELRGEHPGSRHYEEMAERARDYTKVRGRMKRAEMLWEALIAELQYRRLPFEEHCDQALQKDRAQDRLLLVGDKSAALVDVQMSVQGSCLEVAVGMNFGTYRLDKKGSPERVYERSYHKATFPDGTSGGPPEVLSSFLMLADLVESNLLQIRWEKAQDEVAAKYRAELEELVASEVGNLPSLQVTYVDNSCVVTLQEVNLRLHNTGDETASLRPNSWQVFVRNKTELRCALRKLIAFHKDINRLEQFSISRRPNKGSR